MDKFGHYYSWFMLIATLLPAVMRLAQPKAMAEMTRERMNSEKKLKRYRLIGWISLVSSFVFVPLYFRFGHPLWMVVAFVIGLLTGAEMIGNAAFPDIGKLTMQNRCYGLVYTLASVGIYFFLIRK